MSDYPPDRRVKTTLATDRLPPHDDAAEKCVLGCILLDPQCITQCVECIKGGADEFYDLRHQTIYGTLLELFEEGEKIDLITLQARLKLWDKLEQVGGLGYIAGLSDGVPSAANLESYLEIVREMHTRRKMIRVATEVVAKMYDPQGEDVGKVLDLCERDMLRAGEERLSESGIKPIKQLVREAVDEMERRANKDETVAGIMTGYHDADKMIGGFRPGQMITLAARPACGKTSLAMNIADYAAVDCQMPVAVFSLEMTAIELTSRLLSARARVNLRDIEDGQTLQRDTPKLIMATDKVAKAPIYIDDTSGLSILQLRAKARRLWHKHGIKLIIIDYLQLLSSVGSHRKYENKHQELSDISQGTKELARELGIPVLILSQLNREIDKDKHRAPRLSDLSGTGKIEQDSDKVLFLYPAGKRDDDDDGDEFNPILPVNMMVAKNRGGPTGIVGMTFFKQYTRFEQAAKVSPEDYPQ